MLPMSVKAEDGEHAIPWEERQNLTYDYDKIMEMVDEFLALLNDDSTTKKKEKAVEELYYQLIEQVDISVTVNAINEVNYYKDVENEKYAKQQEALEQEVVEIADAVYLALKEALESPYRHVFENLLDEDIIRDIEEYEELTESDKEFIQKETQLLQEYDQAYKEDYRSDEERNTELASIYQELVSIRTEMAKREGYDNYAEYIYDSKYLRDYSLEQVKQLCKAIKKESSYQYYDILWDYMMSIDWDTDIWYIETPVDEKMEEVKPYLKDISPELDTVFEYLRENELYDMDADSKKSELGFTIDLPYYGDAFIYDCPYGYFMDYATLIHEFGHFYNFYISDETYLFEYTNVDVSEIHSQGLEALLLDHSADMLGDQLGEAYWMMQMIKFMDAITMGAMIAEFEIAVYEDGGMSIEEMNHFYGELMWEYEYQADSDYDGYGWAEISSIFRSPGYYIGYATSALSSLELLSISQNNRAGAVGMYLQLTEMPSYTGYCEAVETVGLSNIFDKGSVQTILQDAQAYMEEGYDVANARRNFQIQWREQEEQSIREMGIGFVVIYVICAILVLLAGAITIIIMVVLRTNEKERKSF